MKKNARLILALLSVLFAVETVHAQNAPYHDQVLSGAGRPIAGALITVCAVGATGVPCLPTVQIYGSSDNSKPLTQPIQTDGYGNFSFYAPPGNYEYTVSGTLVGPTSAIPFTVPCQPGVSCAALASNNAFTAPNSFAQPVTSTVATGTAPFSIASTTVVPNLNAQLHNGKTAPAGNIVGDTDSQTLSNKTFDISLNTLKTATNTAAHYPRNNGTAYVDSTIQATDVPVFVASGASHAPGAVPDPGASAGTTHFLREDATWATVPPSGVSEATFGWGNGVQVNLGSGAGTCTTDCAMRPVSFAECSYHRPIHFCTDFVSGRMRDSGGRRDTGHNGSEQPNNAHDRKRHRLRVG